MRINALSDTNLYYTSVALSLDGRDPTFQEAVRHYFIQTGPHIRVITFTVEEIASVEAREAA